MSFTLSVRDDISASHWFLSPSFAPHGKRDNVPSWGSSGKVTEPAWPVLWVLVVALSQASLLTSGACPSIGSSLVGFSLGPLTLVYFNVKGYEQARILELPGERNIYHTNSAFPI